MAADVSSAVRLLGRHGREGSSNGDESAKADLVTKDLLGGCCDVGGGGGGGVAPSPVPKKATLSGIHVFSEADEHLHAMELNLNLSPVCISDPPAIVCAAPQDHIISSPAPDLRLRHSLNQSICTLEKVKSALERADWESRRRRPPRQQQIGVVQGGSASPTSSSTTTSSAKRRLGGGADGGEEAGSRMEVEWAVMNEDGGGMADQMAVAACPSCMMYVLVRASNPRCPRCSIVVPLPPRLQRLPGVASKRAHIDLNADALADTPTVITFF